MMMVDDVYSVSDGYSPVGVNLQRDPLEICKNLCKVSCLVIPLLGAITGIAFTFYHVITRHPIDAYVDVIPTCISGTIAFALRETLNTNIASLYSSCFPNR